MISHVYNDLAVFGSVIWSKDISEFPVQGRPGEIVVKDGRHYAYTKITSTYWTWLPIGIQQSAYVHSQEVPSTTWVIAHNLGTVDYGVFVYDTDHNLITANHRPLNYNTVEVTLYAATAGTAVVFAVTDFSATSINSSDINASSLTIDGVTLTAVNGELVINGELLGTVTGTTVSWSNVESTPTTLLGYGITDAASINHNHSLDSLSNVSVVNKSIGDILKWNGTAWVNNTLSEAGIQPAGSYLTSNQLITVTGDVTGSGTNNINLTLADSGVTSGVYNTSSTTITPFTVDDKGRVISTSTPITITPDWSSITGKPTTLIGYGITDAASSSHTHNYAGSATPGGAANQVANPLIIKFDSGSIEGTSLYTFDGSASKLIDIKAGTNISITKGVGSITINSTATGGEVSWSSIIDRPDSLLDISETEGAKLASIDDGATRNIIYRQPTDPNDGTNVISDGDMWVDTSGAIVVEYVRVGGQWEVSSTVGAAFDVDSPGAVTGQITSSNISTWFENASIGNAQIGTLSADKITTGTLSADRINANTISASKLILTTWKSREQTPSVLELEKEWQTLTANTDLALGTLVTGPYQNKIRMVVKTLNSGTTGISITVKCGGFSHTFTNCQFNTMYSVTFNVSPNSSYALASRCASNTLTHIAQGYSQSVSDNFSV